MPAKKRLTCKKINDFIKDERAAVKEYHDLGLYGLSASEAKHLKFFQQQKQKRKCR